MPGVLVNSMQAPRVAAPKAAPPPPGVLEGLGATIRTTFDLPAEHGRIEAGYHSLAAAMREVGFDTDRYSAPIWERAIGRGGDTGFYDPDAMFRDIADAKKRDPRRYAGLPNSREEYELSLLTRNGQRAEDQATSARSSWAVRLAGGAIGSFADPLNIATLPIGGGGKTILQTAAREAGLNALIEAIQQPFVAQQRARLGEKLTAAEAVENVVSAGVGGFVLGGGFHAAGTVLPKAAEAVGGTMRSAQEATLARLWPALPESVRSRWASAADMPDSAIPDLVEEIVGDAITPDTADALNVLRRENRIAANNPFVQNAAGIEAYADGLRSEMARILSDAPPAQRPAALRGSTAIGTGTVDASARSVVKNRIGVVENATGSNTIKNPRSTATGKYQFTEGTWRALYVRRFGAQGLSAAEIAAKRTDPRLQDVLMDDLMGSNAAALQRAGEAQTPGNLYLAHFAGQDGAVRLLQADPGASAEAVLGKAAIDANPFLRGMTADDVIGWANRKMGQDWRSPRAGERVEIAADAPGSDQGSGLQQRIQEELDRTEGQRAQMLDPVAAPEPSPATRIPDDVIATPIEMDAAIPLAKTVRSARPPRVMDLRQFVAWNGGIRDNAGHDLNGMFDGNPFVPGVGKFVRADGRNLDDMIELAHEAGYFGPPSTVDRPTEAEMLDMLDRSHRQGERLFSIFDQDEAAARLRRLRETDEGIEFEDRLSNAASERGIDLDDDFAAEAFVNYDGDFETAIDAVINGRLQAELDKVLAEADPAMYEALQQAREKADGYGAEPREDGYSSQRPEDYDFDAGDAGVDGARAVNGRSAEPLSRQADLGGGPLPEIEQARWDDPAGDAAVEQAESIEHDVRMTVDAVDPNVADRQRQQAQLGADAPLRGGNKTGKEQDGTMGLGLFDAADQPEFRLDAEGGTTNPKDLLARLDDEEAEIQRIRNCAQPKKGDAE